MRKLLIILQLITAILIFGKRTCNAQPGGGGGLTIKGLYNQSGIPIAIDDPNLKIRKFVLSGQMVQEEIYNVYSLYFSSNSSFYLANEHQPFDHQRLIITYHDTLMIVDISDIMQANGAGHTESMDSIFFNKGYFSFSMRTRYDYNTIDYSEFARLKKFGLTPYTIPLLTAKFNLYYTQACDTDFLKEENLSSHFILNRGINYYRQEQNDDALADISIAIKRGLNKNDLENAYATLSACYKSQKNYAQSLYFINKIINELHVADNYYLMSYYKARIEIFTALRQFNNALNDFDFIILHAAENTNAYIAEKAEYKARYMNNCKGGLEDFMTILDHIPDSHLNDRPGGFSEYADTYFQCGLLEYSCGEKQNAFIHLLKAMEFGYAQTSADYAVVCFDTLIEQNTNEGRLYLARAIAYYKRAPYLGWGDETKSVLMKSVLETEKAEETGLNDYRVYLYRAQSLNLLKMNDDALIEINTAIKKNKSDPRAYAVRYRILSDLGKTVWGKDHEDLIKYRELSKQWNFNEK